MVLLLRGKVSTYLRPLRRWEESDHGSAEPVAGFWHPERVPRGWVETGRAVDARRRLMGLSVKDLARNAGVDPRTVADLIHARRESFTDDTLSGLERALAWRQGSVLRMAMEGHEPQDDEGLADIIAAWPTLSPELRAALVRIVGR